MLNEKGLDYMTNLKRAVLESHTEWIEEIEQRYKQALENGELPQKTQEEVQQESNMIWELAHKEQKHLQNRK